MPLTLTAMCAFLCSPFAKPLVVMSPKWLLHHRPCASSLADMMTGTFFQRVILEGSRGDNMKGKSDKTDLLPANEIERVIFCSGKVRPSFHSTPQFYISLCCFLDFLPLVSRPERGKHTVHHAGTGRTDRTLPIRSHRPCHRQVSVSRASVGARGA